jgi:hypothetical protein
MELVDGRGLLGRDAIRVDARRRYGLQMRSVRSPPTP